MFFVHLWFYGRMEFNWELVILLPDTSPVANKETSLGMIETENKWSYQHKFDGCLGEVWGCVVLSATSELDSK